MDDDLITLAQLAGLVGYGGTWVRKLAREDPNFPERTRVGGAWAVRRAEAEAYFKARGKPPKGRPPSRQAEH
jgi:predicted DNA-binding transcriptional regulator AlpA